MSSNTENKPDAENKPNETVWSRPMAQKKDRHFRTWLLFAGVILLAFSLWAPLRSLWSRYSYALPDRDTTRDSQVFVSLAYPGVSEEGIKPESRDLTPQTFEAQMRELARRGYQAIGLEDLRAFYLENKPLPRRALLLTFEQTRKSSYFETRSILKDLKWRAVMGIWTRPMETGDAQVLLWPYLQDMRMLGTWDFALESRSGFDLIPAGPNGETGPFFSTPMWLKGQYRFETPSEFEQRLAEDHKKVIDLFRRELSIKPTAFFFPYGDYGQYNEQARVIRDANLRQVATNYLFGFTLGNLALNTRHSDVKRLNRLLVDKNWSPKDLADRLDAFLPDKDGKVKTVRDFTAGSWVREWGGVSIEQGGELALRAIPPENPLDKKELITAGAKAWLAGSDNFKDGFVSMRFHLRRGRFVISLRSSSKGEFVQFSLDSTGHAAIRQKKGTETDALLAIDTELDDQRTDYQLLLALRGNYMYAVLNDKLLFGGRVLLQGEPAFGPIGAGVWDDVSGIAEAQIFSTKLIEAENAIAFWQPEVSRDAVRLASWLKENAYRITVLSPPWMNVTAAAALRMPPWDKTLITTISITNGQKIYPRLFVQEPGYLPKLSTDEVLAELKTTDASGLFVDAIDCEPEQLGGLYEWLLRLRPGLTAAGLDLVLRLPIVAEGMSSSGNMLARISPVILAGDFKGQPPFGLRWDQSARAVPVEPRSGEGPLALYYQIAGAQGKDGDMTLDAQIELLRRKGFDAFALGEYEKAAAAWEEWTKLAPEQPDSWALRGDVYLRLNRQQDALESYTKSLSLNPGQVDLALRRSRLLEKMGRPDEQADTLNLYARAFPGTVSVVIEQAKWLLANKRRTEACELMRKLVQEHPEEVEARQILQTMLDDPKARYENLRELTDQVKAGSSHLYGFGQVLANSDLLSGREAAILFPLIRQAATEAPLRSSRRLFAGFLPTDEIVSEEFKDAKISDHWIAFGSSARPDSTGRFELRAGSDMAEAYLRLKRSDFIRDGFIEVDLHESVGFFWLYARRSSSAMIRFGFDDEGYIRIQSWVNGELRSSDSRAWLRPPGTVNVRLEVRGDGAYGYINGKPAFSTGLSIPNDLRYGWWSLAPFSPELGMARAKIGRIAAGPLPVTMLIIPPMLEDEVSPFLDLLRNSARETSIIAPVLFRQRQNGEIEEISGFQIQMIRLFASYRRQRIVPVIDASYFSEADIAGIIALVKKYNLTGIAVCTRSVPGDAWFRELETGLEKTSATAVVVSSVLPFWSSAEPNRSVAQMVDAKPFVSLRQLERGNLLFPPEKLEWKGLTVGRYGTNGISPVVPYEMDKVRNLAEKGPMAELNVPRLFVFPSKGSLRGALGADSSAPSAADPVRGGGR